MMVLAARLFTTFAVAGSLMFCGCSTTDQIRLSASSDQKALLRDGIPALVSQKKHLVMLRPNGRTLSSNSRPSFTIAVKNFGTEAENLLERDVLAWNKIVANQEKAIRIFTYDQLVEEEDNRQKMRAVAVALAGVGQAMSAANAGYVHTTGTVRANSYGTYGGSPYSSNAYGTYSGTTYDPLRAQLAQQAAQAQTHANFEQVREEGERNLSALQQSILKDHTVLPGEWHGGTIVLSPPEKNANGVASYTISVRFGGELHEFQIDQAKN